MSVCFIIYFPLFTTLSVKTSSAKSDDENFFADEIFKIVLFCNNFSFFSRNQIYYEFIVCGIQLIQGNIEKRRNY